MFNDSLWNITSIDFENSQVKLAGYRNFSSGEELAAIDDLQSPTNVWHDDLILWTRCALLTHGEYVIQSVLSLAKRLPGFPPPIELEDHLLNVGTYRASVFVQLSLKHLNFRWMPLDRRRFPRQASCILRLFEERQEAAS